MANFTPNQNEYNNMTPFKTWLKYQINTWGLNSFPFVESDFDDLTNYAMMMKLMKHFNTLIENQNMVEEDMTNLYNAFTELQAYLFDEFADYKNELNASFDEYKNQVDGEIEQFETDITADFNELHDFVDNYFDNNFPQLVSDKLDEMASDGTLENLLNDTAHLTKSYNTYTEMMADSSTFTNGLRLKTYGYYSRNDGGNAEYYVNNEVINHNYQIDLENGLYINLICDDVNVKQFGAKGDNVNNDTTSFQNAINYANNVNKNLYIPIGKYKIDSSLNINTNVIGNNAYIYYIGTSSSDYLINFTSTIENNNYIENIKLYCNKLINGISFNKTNGESTRSNQRNIYVNSPLEIGVLINNGGGVYNNIFASHELKSYTYDGNTYYQLDDNISNKIGIKITNADNFLNNVRCYGFGTGLKLEAPSTRIEEFKMFVNYNGVVIKRTSSNRNISNYLKGQLQENYGQPIIIDNVGNSEFNLLIDGNGVVNGSSTINLVNDSTAGYDSDNNPIGCINITNSTGNLFNIISQTRKIYSANRRVSCERNIINIDLNGSSLSHHNTINIYDYNGTNRNDGYPQFINYGDIYSLLANSINLNNDSKEKLLPYKIEKIDSTDIYTSSSITRTSKLNGYNLQYTGSTTIFCTFDIDIAKSLGKNIFWKIPISNQFRYNSVTITPYYSMYLSDNSSATYSDTTSRSLNNGTFNRDNFITGFISKSTMEGLSNYTTETSNITHVRVGFSLSFSSSTTIDMDIGKPEIFIA